MNSTEDATIAAEGDEGIDALAEFALGEMVNWRLVSDWVLLRSEDGKTKPLGVGNKSCRGLVSTRFIIINEETDIFHRNSYFS